VARTLLFLSIGRRASVGSVALCGVEPGAGRLGDRSGSVDVVKRSGPLRNGGRERVLGFRRMAESLDWQHLEEVSCGRRDGIQAGRDSSVHAHGPAVG
jgi:hypothetical protein